MVLVLFLVVAAFIVFFQFTQPEYEDIQVVRGEEFARRDFVEKQQSAITQVKKLIAEYEDSLDFQTLVSASFPGDQDIYSAVAQIGGLVSLDSLTLQSFSVTETKAQELQISGGDPNSSKRTSLIRPYGTITFRLQLIGTYEDIKSFLGHIETNIRLFDISSADIRPAAKSNVNVFSASVEVTTYYQGSNK
ncbi:MAG: hypothetical protein G01um101420_739 [Parcubacteria group bacterium Gr01-1014_20]|nr:MAG: hypothetical protein G01um101420_739 [Parcubacteria group bacterium Gr01-1014_20]